MCNFHCFGGPQYLTESCDPTKQWEINNAHDNKKILKKEKKNFYPGKSDICKTCGPPKEWELHTAHDRESSLFFKKEQNECL